MADVVAKFSLNNRNINARFDLNEGNTVDAIFKIDAAGTTWGSIDGDIANQTDLYNILNTKANQSELDSLSETVSDNYTALESEINGLSSVVDNNYSETIERFENDELAVSNLTNTVSNNYTELNNKVLANSTHITSISDTINSFGDIVTYNASNFATSAQGALANTALQPNDNISELVNDVGYITSASLPVVNNGTLTIRANNETLGTFTANQAGDTTVEISIPDSATWGNITGNIQNQTDLANALNGKQDNLTAQDGITLNNNIISGKPLEDAIGDIDELIPVQATAQNQLADKNFVNSSIATNTANFIGTFNSVAELEAYSGTLTNNDYAFVSTTDSAGNTLYDRYKWNGSQWLFEYELNNSSFTAAQWASINSGITSGDVSLISTAIQPNDNISELTNDVGYITSTSLPTVNNSNITLQKNGVDVGSFTLNQSSNSTINFSVPTDTSDLTNNAGFITGITSSDVTTALGYTPYSASNPNGYITSSDLPTNYVTTDTAQDISGRKTFLGEKAIYFKQLTTANKLGFTLYNPSNTELGALEYRPNTIGGKSLLALNCPQTTDGYVGFRYWGTPAVNIVAPKVATAGNYFMATHITDGTNTVTANNNGTLNISTLLPDVSNLANKDLSNLSSTGNAKFQAPLISGTNIKTINNNSILGSGNLTLDGLPSQTGQSGKFLTTNGTSASWATVTTPSIDIDNKSITENSNDELQTVGVIDQNNTTNAIKTWTGTKAQYDAIVTKDPNQLYFIEDDSDVTFQLLELLFPVGAVYFGTMSTCPLQTLGVGTWQALPQDKVIQIAGTRGGVGDTLNESLPNIKGGFLAYTYSNGSASGAFTSFVSNPNQLTAGSTSNVNYDQFTLDASTYSSTYQNNAPVQQDAYLLNGWRRIA